MNARDKAKKIRAGFNSLITQYKEKGDIGGAYSIKFNLRSLNQKDLAALYDAIVGLNQ